MNDGMIIRAVVFDFQGHFDCSEGQVYAKERDSRFNMWGNYEWKMVKSLLLKTGFQN
jgi:hypothetical protein